MFGTYRIELFVVKYRDEYNNTYYYNMLFLFFFFFA